MSHVRTLSQIPFLDSYREYKRAQSPHKERQIHGIPVIMKTTPSNVEISYVVKRESICLLMHVHTDKRAVSDKKTTALRHVPR